MSEQSDSNIIETSGSIAVVPEKAGLLFSLPCSPFVDNVSQKVAGIENLYEIPLLKQNLLLMTFESCKISYLNTP